MVFYIIAYGNLQLQHDAYSSNKLRSNGSLDFLLLLLRLCLADALLSVLRNLVQNFSGAGLDEDLRETCTNSLDVLNTRDFLLQRVLDVSVARERRDTPGNLERPAIRILDELCAHADGNTAPSL